ncbi:copper ion binding protein [Petroclostridium sp. X23]|uniref:heavy-metal-associated domain-containing protein n=1 Tax=Petroclostridium sp. X23 TaxID=3045146 RepID=UPI0024ACDD22|nr:copper ion binding protein [Petroclostridium sp. X23]WHH61532.1 copper ion binding protein [Petroclostridium sp. X23]
MTKKIFIEGMSCGHCVKHVEEALKEVSGVSSVSVSLEGKFAEVRLNSQVSDDALKAAIEDVGYDVVKID